MDAGQAVTLVLGGSRSGKSAVAEQLVAAGGGPVTYVATGPAAVDGDEEWAARVAAHRARRPASWATLEVPAGGDLAAIVRAADGAVLVESLGTWVAGFADFAAPVAELCDALTGRRGRSHPTVVVSEEAGMGVHPATAVGRAWADALGEVNQAVAGVAGRVLLVVVGRVLELGPLADAGGSRRPSTDTADPSRAARHDLPADRGTSTAVAR